MADGVRRRVGGTSPLRGGEDDGYARLVEDKEKTQLLGFRHWLLALVVLGSVYATVVHFHYLQPKPKSADDYTHFSELRARPLLREIAGLGPRPSGSVALEKHAIPLLERRIGQAAATARKIGANRVEYERHHPTGCFDLVFLSSFSLCYENVTNVVARIGPAKGPAEHALLLNCHIDSMPDTPGATDDAVSCAIMVDLLEVLAHSKEPLKYDIVFLFNGAEENFLQGAHGFIESHPWRHTVRAFINLEGTGSGGREILFQAGPGNSWLLQAYLDAAPHPYCSILAQEIFQSGVIPSDTDFRIFRDFGRVSGLDIAYTRNGWVYHTEFDEEHRMDVGCMQRAGDNVLAVIKKVLSEDDLAKPGKAAEQNKWVFYDVVGLFTVRYTVELGKLLNVATAALSILFVALRIRKGTYSAGDMATVFLRHACSLLAMALAGAAIVAIVYALDLTMCWYAMPELIGGLYVLPMATAGMYVHALFHAKQYIRNSEMAHFDSVLLLLSVCLLWMTSIGLASAFFLLNYLLFGLMRDPILFALGRIGVIRKVTPHSILYVQLISLLPAMVFAAYAISQCVDFFVPVIGRLGRAVYPEFVMAPLGLVIAFTFVLFTNNLVYVSRPLRESFRVSFLLFVFLLVALVFTHLGVPYKYHAEQPRLRRLIALHSSRSIYDFSDRKISQESALLIQSFDWRSTSDLPAHSFLQGKPPPDCNQTKDEYCRLPYYTAVHQLFPTSESLWIAVPAPPIIPYPIGAKLLAKERVGRKRLNMTIEISGGYDKMSLHITPLNDFELKEWSFTKHGIETIGKRDTYFVFLTYGTPPTPPTRRFWLLMEYTGPEELFPDINKQPSLELAVASHHAHGEHQNSDTMRQLRALVKSRRELKDWAVGWWKWGITLIGGQSEIIVKQY